MRKTIFTLLVVLFCIAATGCDAGLEIVDMEIEKYPNKIVYFLGVDKELDLTGGVVEYTLKQNSKSTDNMGDESITVSHDIDFNKPGVYVVELKRHIASCKFPIQVIKIG